MILCEKCNNFYFPEVDEDNNWTLGCKNPNVIDVFQNFCRKEKCRYYRKISYEKMLDETKKLLRRLLYYSYYQRQRRLNQISIERLKILRNDYIEYRDYLFNIKREGQRNE